LLDESNGVQATWQHMTTHSVSLTDMLSLTFRQFLELGVLIQQTDVGFAPPHLSVLVILIVMLILT
jgi:hypothetical protein